MHLPGLPTLVARAHSQPAAAGIRFCLLSNTSCDLCACLAYPVQADLIQAQALIVQANLIQAKALIKPCLRTEPEQQIVAILRCGVHNAEIAVTPYDALIEAIHGQAD